MSTARVSNIQVDIKVQELTQCCSTTSDAEHLWHGVVHELQRPRR